MLYGVRPFLYFLAVVVVVFFCGYHSSDIYGYRSIGGISSDGFGGGCGIGVLGASSVYDFTLD